MKEPMGRDAWKYICSRMHPSITREVVSDKGSRITILRSDLSLFTDVTTMTSESITLRGSIAIDAYKDVVSRNITLAVQKKPPSMATRYDATKNPSSLKTKDIASVVDVDLSYEGEMGALSLLTQEDHRPKKSPHFIKLLYNYKTSVLTLAMKYVNVLAGEQSIHILRMMGHDDVVMPPHPAIVVAEEYTEDVADGNPDVNTHPSFLTVGYLISFIDDTQWYIDKVDPVAGLVHMHGFCDEKSHQIKSIQWCIEHNCELMSE